MKYERQNCVHCGREFAKNDDIVVCPVCGTPHHRECWADGNGCGNAFRHEEGYVYKNPNTERESMESEKCPSCGNENPQSALFCAKCGHDLTSGASAQKAPQGAPPFISFDFTPPKNPYEKSDEKIDDIPASEVAKRVLIKPEYYVPKFKKLSKRKIPVSWNWASFLMPNCVWFYYRKCYLAGTLAAIFDIVLQVLFNGFLTAFNEIPFNVYTDAEVMAEFWRLVLSPTGLAFFGITIGFRILMGLGGNAIYKAQVMNDIRKNADSEKPTVGGTNFLTPVIGYFLFSNLAMIIINIIG